MPWIVGLGATALLFAWGIVLDRAAALPQLGLLGALHVASLGGAALTGWCLLPAWQTRRERALLLGAALLGWRLAYFPIMVFSGHVASVAEWLALLGGLPVLVYPVFLLFVFGAHATVATGAAWVVRPPHLVLRYALLPAFAVALAVSVTTWRDLHPLPDRAFSLPRAPQRAVEARENPYLPALVGPGYFPTQRVMLLAAGVTYETIPESPWGRTVKSVLEADFHENPHGNTHDRVVEHYLAYHSAQPFLGCRDLADCPVPGALPAP